MAEPTELPIWDENDTNTDVIPDTLKDDGFGLKQKAPSPIFNSWFRNVYKWIEWFKAKFLLVDADIERLQPVESIAALRALDITDYSNGATITATGYYAKGDGGGGPIRYLDTGQIVGFYTDNGGSIIVPDGGDGSVAWLVNNTNRVNVKTFGAKCDGISDDTVAVNTVLALNYDTGAFAGWWTIGGLIVELPAGVAITTGPLIAKPGTTIIGAGKVKSLIKRTTDGPVITLGDGDIDNATNMLMFSDFSMEGTDDITSHGIYWTGATGEPTLVQYLTMRDINYKGNGYAYYQNPLLGAGVGLYGAQNISLERVVTTWAQGVIWSTATNILRVKDCGTEGGVFPSGPGLGQYYVQGTNAGQSGFLGQVTVEGCLSEGSGETKGFVFSNIEHLGFSGNWFEFSGVTNTQNSLEIDGCTFFDVERFFNPLVASNPIVISNTDTGTIDGVLVVADAISDGIQIDESTCNNITLRDCKGQNSQYSKTWGNTPDIENCIRTTSVTGWNIDYSIPNTINQNLLLNGSFEAGQYGWAGISAVETFASVSSTVTSGKMLTMTTDGATVSQGVNQARTITAGMVGQPLTISILVKCSQTDANMSIYATGVGIAAQSSIGLIVCSGEWVPASLTIVPQSSGTLLIGLWTTRSPATVYDIDMDCFTMVSGTKPVLANIAINNEHISASAAPTTGTWNTLDNIWNSIPASGQPMGWTCTSPPTNFKAMANYA